MDDNLRVRIGLALAAILLILATAVAPHAHTSPLGRHACMACVVAGAEKPVDVTPDVAPRAFIATSIRTFAPDAPVTGAPLGAKPGQSPPRV